MFCRGMLRREPEYHPSVHRRKTYVAEFQLKSSAIFSATAAATLLLVGSQAKAQNDGARWSRTPQGGASVRRAVVAQQQQQSVSMMPQRAPFQYSRRMRPVFPGQRADGSQQQFH